MVLSNRRTNGIIHLCLIVKFRKIVSTVANNEYNYLQLHKQCTRGVVEYKHWRINYKVRGEIVSVTNGIFKLPYDLYGVTHTAVNDVKTLRWT